jgi:hypothetical protein
MQYRHPICYSPLMQSFWTGSRIWIILKGDKVSIFHTQQFINFRLYDGMAQITRFSLQEFVGTLRGFDDYVNMVLEVSISEHIAVKSFAINLLVPSDHGCNF